MPSKTPKARLWDLTSQAGGDSIFGYAYFTDAEFSKKYCGADCIIKWNIF